MLLFTLQDLVIATSGERRVLPKGGVEAGLINQTSPASEGGADRRESERTLAQGGAGCMPNAEEEKPVLHRPAKEGQAMQDGKSQDRLDLDFQAGPEQKDSGLCDKTPVKACAAAQAEEGGSSGKDELNHECLESSGSSGFLSETVLHAIRARSEFAKFEDKLLSDHPEWKKSDT